MFDGGDGCVGAGGRCLMVVMMGAWVQVACV